MKPIRKIVVAVDFSEHVDPVLDAAVDFARQFNAELHLVHAFDVRYSAADQNPIQPSNVNR